jgi:hypothetical protein
MLLCYTDTQAFVTVQEIRWNATGVSEMKRYKMFYTCHDKGYKFGAGFANSRRVKPTVMQLDTETLRVEDSKILQ